jgi:hypothetical protein
VSKIRKESENREIGVPRVIGNGTTKVSKFRELIGNVQLEGRVAIIQRYRRRPIGGLHRHIGNRDIGDPKHKGFLHRRIAIRDFPIRPRSVGPH